MVPNGWKFEYPAHLVTLLSGFAFKSSDATSAGTRWLKIANVGIGEIKWDDQSYLPSNYADEYERFFLDVGDIVVAMTRPTLGNQLKIAKLETTCDRSLLNQRVAKLVVSEEGDSDFVYQLFRTEHIAQRINLALLGTDPPNLSVSILKDFKVAVPPLPEQKKIAQILSTWDKAITATEQLLANGQQQKKALMQQLLTGKKRLGMPASDYEFKKTRYGAIPKDWEYPAIKDVCTQVSEKNTDSNDYPVLSCSKYDGFVDSLKYFKKKVYSDDTSGYRLIHRGCFGFPSNHVEEGSIGLQNLYDTGIVSPIYVVFRANPKKVDNTYLYAVLKTDHYRQMFSAATNASVDRRGSLRWKEFGLIHVPLPPLEEQQKIATVLSTADQEISALQQKLDALNLEKKALMQQLLTGKRRVQIN